VYKYRRVHPLQTTHTYACTQTSVSCSHDAGLDDCMYQFLPSTAVDMPREAPMPWKSHILASSSSSSSSSHACACRAASRYWCVLRGDEVSATSSRVLALMASEQGFSHVPIVLKLCYRRERRGLLTACALILHVILFAGLLGHVVRLRRFG
jgi:hypothetical protein